MADREPARERYDAAIDLGVGPGGSMAAAVVKMTYRLGSGWSRCTLAPALPLENDIRDPDLEPRIPPHTDFWTRKYYVDVGVEGNAYSPGGRPVEYMRAGIEIADRAKHVEVFGNRTVEWTAAGRPRIGAPEPFEEIPLDHRHAYGGCDFRVPFDDEDPRALGVTLDADHPGLYPRNPWGTGYIAVDEPLEGFRLPNLEDPRDRLTDERVVAHPEGWYRQPMPWYLDWTPINCFPRNLFISLECEPWFPPPDDGSLPEARFGLLPTGYRTELAGQALGMRPSWQFHQEASHGLVLPTPPYDARLRLLGMHPERAVIECRLPEKPPVVDLAVEGQWERMEPKLTTVAVYPDRELLAMVWVVSRPTPRPFVPGIHKHIPVAVSVDGDEPVHYDPPPTVKERLAAAEEESER